MMFILRETVSPVLEIMAGQPGTLIELLPGPQLIPGQIMKVLQRPRRGITAVYTVQ